MSVLNETQWNPSYQLLVTTHGHLYLCCESAAFQTLLLHVCRLVRNRERRSCLRIFEVLHAIILHLIPIRNVCNVISPLLDSFGSL